VSDPTENAGKSGGLRSLFYEILGTTIKVDILVESDGSFNFQFITTNLPEIITVKITAQDWNGNTSERSLTFKNAGNDIPSFTATPDNHKITLNWDNVPLARSYAIYYTTNGTFPSEYFGKKIENAESPFVFSGLKNGNLHIFLLQAPSPEGYEDNWSDYQKAIPLSKNTLAPIITSYYGKLLVEWENIPKTDDFEVWRAESKDGPFF